MLLILYCGLTDDDNYGEYRQYLLSSLTVYICSSIRVETAFVPNTAAGLTNLHARFRQHNGRNFQ